MAHSLLFHLIFQFASISGLFEYLKKNNQKVEMITNAGMFTPTGEPKGLYIENGKTLFKLDKLRENPAEKGVNFYLRRPRSYETKPLARIRLVDFCCLRIRPLSASLAFP